MTNDNKAHTVPPSTLADFVFSLSSVLLSATKQDIVYFKNKDTLTTYKSFINDPTQASLFITKQITEPEETGFTVSRVLSQVSAVSSAIALIKGRGYILEYKPLDSQIQIINLPLQSSEDRNDSFETLRSLVSLGIAPYFDTLSKSGRQDNLGEDTNSIGQTKKKINELVLSLAHLQQTVQIPDLKSGCHPTIKDLITTNNSLLADSDLVNGIPENLLTDSVFLNSIQATVNKWVKSVQEVTQLTHNPKDSTAKDEVEFWISMEIALLDIQDQLSSQEVLLTLEVLKKGKRFHATVSFLSDTGIKEALTVAQKYNAMMRDIPLDEILSATTFNKLGEAIILVFNHLKKLRVSQYPIDRAIAFVEVISSDVATRMRSILSPLRPMSLKTDEFKEVMRELQVCFDIFDMNVKETTSMARELVRKRNEKFILVKIDSKTAPFQEVITDIIKFRNRHNELINTITKIGLDNDLISGLDYAYSAVKDVDITDSSLEGRKTWDAREKLYNERIYVVQNTVISMLKRLLAAAKNSNEMFEIFQNFKVLLSQDSVRNAIQEYQSQLLNVVKSDIKSLQSQFLKQNEVTKLFKLRDIPPVSGTVMWAKQIELRLNYLTERCELILGPNWKQYPEGQKIFAEALVFKTKLSTDGIFEAWLKDSLKHNHKSFENSEIFKIVKSSATSTYEIIVAFDTSVMNLFKEVRHLCWLNYDVPSTIISNSRLIRKIYPHAIGITESLLVWSRAVEETQKLDELSTLLDADMKAIFKLIESLISTKWDVLVRANDLTKLTNVSDLHLADLEEMKTFRQVSLLEESIFKFSGKIVFLQNIRAEFNSHLSRLGSCPYNIESFQEEIAAIQHLVDAVTFEDFAGIDELVSRLNIKIQSILDSRCLVALSIWHSQISTVIEEHAEELAIDKDHQLAQSRHEIVIRDQTVMVIPPAESSKKTWYNELNVLLHVTTSQNLIAAGSIDVNLANKKSSQLTFLMDSISATVNKCVDLLETAHLRVKHYIGSWLKFQALWDLDVDEVFLKLSDDINRWLLLISEFKSSRETFDTIETSKSFGPLTVEYKHAQSKINAKFDIWQKQMTLRFADVLRTSMSQFDALILNLKKLLEKSDMSNIVNLITHVDRAQRESAELATALKSFFAGETHLVKSRFKLPSDWLYFDQIKDNFDSLTQILSKKKSLILHNIAIISQQIESQSDQLEDLANRIRVEWSSERPITGDLAPSFALNVLQNFESSVTDFQVRKGRLTSCAEILSIHVTGISNLDSVLGEIFDLKTVWTSIDTLWLSLHRLKNMKWVTIVPRELRRALDDLLSKSRNMPARVRQYSAFEEVQDLIKGYASSIKMIGDLLSDSMKDHHWKSIFAMLHKSNIPLEKLLLGDVWDLDLSLNKSLFSSVIERAIGEKTIEAEIFKIESRWAEMTFQYLNYQNKIRLVKNWETLFESCTEDINSLKNMQHSFHFKIFKQRGSTMTDKLQKLYRLLDTWIEVQKEFVYLDGVFTSGTDIKKILPAESSRFQNLSTEFFLSLKSVYRSSAVIDVLTIPDIQRSMERILDFLTKVTKSLSDYLEKQRELFPRFYFVGNEDLLEIIGNSHRAEVVAKHFKALFNGIAGAICDGHVIKSVVSSEGEVLELSRPVSFENSIPLNVWLSELEYEVKVTLSKICLIALTDFKKVSNSEISAQSIVEFVDNYQSQIIILSAQIYFTELTETSIRLSQLENALNIYSRLLVVLSSVVSKSSTIIRSRKYENLIIEFIHQRDVVYDLMRRNTKSKDDFAWRSVQRFYYNENCTDTVSAFTVEHGNASFAYGFEYLGVQNRLVYTPLIDKCFLSMTQALHQKVGGSPFGPAGTGKTESVKALGQNLGKMVLVFCCDESFDFQAMGRILLGICEVGAWACFDEFNRLDEKMLSAVSSQIETIELSLSQPSREISLLGKNTHVHPETGVFITMNPGYAGRSQLPENLKKLFRSFSMDKPDREIITEVLLISQGFIAAKELTEKLVPFFSKLENSVTKQTHYDFGLRALKSMLSNCGASKKRNKILNLEELEVQTILRSLDEIVAPKLIADDERLFEKLQKEFFGSKIPTVRNGDFENSLRSLSENLKIAATQEFMKRGLQLYQMQEAHHGIILYGAAGVGKTTIWKQVLSAICSVEHTEASYHIIDCKVMSKEALYGFLDPVTHEWSDGLLTSILRKVKENARGELTKKNWIILDGDVDPEWIENLNSVLDDNKVLTLPNGERIELPPCVKLIFEVDSLRYATPATISRCGIIFVANSLCTPFDMFQKLMSEMELNFTNDEDSHSLSSDITSSYVRLIRDLVKEETLNSILSGISRYKHMLKSNTVHALKKFQVMLSTFARKALLSYDAEDLSKYTLKAILISCCWALAGDCSADDRMIFSEFICEIFYQPRPKRPFTDYTINPQTLELTEYQVPSTSLEWHEITRPDLIIPTADTIKHESLIHSVLCEHVPIIMCGPPGSGKTMTFLSALKKSPNLEFVDLNFSKDSSPAQLLKILEQYGEYKNTASGMILAPRSPGKWLVVFADEINLPRPDIFETQAVISLLRQLVERNGFYKHNQWVSLSNIQFVGACNSASDPGRNELSLRFVRNVMVISINYPSTESLYQIYGTLATTVLRRHHIVQYSDALTAAMIIIYEKLKFTYNNDVISPRELSRLIKGLLVYLEGSVALDDLLRVFLFNSLRVYSDRAPLETIRSAIFEIIRSSIIECFPNRSEDVFKLPVLYSNWLSLTYQEVSERELRAFVSERMRVFCEEELDVSLVLYDDLLDHILRIDRVLKQPQGHLILVGPSSSGKTTLTKFVSWINSFKVIQLSTHRNYTLDDFDQQLKEILKRTALTNEKISFIVDESNILETSFLERMNNLLSSCEIPGLFEEDEIKAMTATLGLEDSEFNNHFKEKIAENLHVIFTVAENEQSYEHKPLSSPALVNRCVVNWMGDWSNTTLYEVGSSLIQSLGVDDPDYKRPEMLERVVPFATESLRDVLVETAIFFHRSLSNLQVNVEFTPGHYLRFIQEFKSLFSKKEERLQEHQRHVNVGLEKLRDTVVTVKTLKEQLSAKSAVLLNKDKEASEMLNKMLTEQNEAERKREASIEIQIALEQQEKEIQQRRSEVMGDLALAEPAVLEAARGVKNIKKEHLNELKAMRNPPESVVLTLESVCSLLGYDTRSWRDVQLVIRGDAFIPDIVNFDNEKMCTPEVIQFMEQTYLSRVDYNYAAANRGSKACGPLLQWVEAQIAYSAVLDKISPLREEVEALEIHTHQTKRKLVAIDEMIHDLEKSIEEYKEEYSALIRETEKIKTELKTVGAKVNRSVKLMEDLTGERERWRDSVKGFHKERSYLAGDSLLSAAFLSYCGFFDQSIRSNLLRVWKSRLVSAQIPTDDNYSPVNHLSDPNDLILWGKNGLTNDDLFVENMILLNRTDVCSFVIDPSEEIRNVILKTEMAKNVIVTSFLDDGFSKQLENALRFGSHILIQDGEHFDPIICPILSKETQRVGRRVLVTIGNQTFDYVPGFKMFIFTKDPSVSIPSFAFSRMTVANFTITESSLIAQSLDMTLKSENPEVEQQRLELMRLNSEYKVHLRKLENELLKSLSTSKGNILEDDEIIATLQQLKTEAKDISYKMEETSHVMKNIDEILDQYFPFASACSTLFALLESFESLNSFYQFSLDFFRDIISRALAKKKEKADATVSDLVSFLYRELYHSTSLSLLVKDRMVLALSMLVLYYDSKEDISVSAIFGHIKEAFSDKTKLDGSTKEIAAALGSESLSGFLSNQSEIKFLKPLLHSLIEAQSRPVNMMDTLNETVSMLWKNDSYYNAKEHIKFHTNPKVPIILVSPDGYDASYLVGKEKLTAVALGSTEGTEIADLEIFRAAKEGGWVLVHNVQMSPQWLDLLEKKLATLSPVNEFRLLLTCNITSSVPNGIIRAADVLMFENSPGLKLIVHELFSSVADGTENSPVEKRHVYFLFSWFHAIIQERLRYVPIGFSKAYDFNNSDFMAGIDIIDRCISSIGGIRTNIDPKLLPWEAFQVLIGETIYGGKVDSSDDYEIVKSLAKQLFVQESFELDFQLADGLRAPEGRSISNYEDWILNLPAVEPPHWIGLDADVEQKVSFANGVQILNDAQRLIA